MMYELSRIVLPAIEYFSYTNLFFNKHEIDCVVDDKLTKATLYNFNTWMNIFPAKKYMMYSHIKDLFLQIEIENDAEILVYGFNYNVIDNPDYLIYKGKLHSNTEQKIEISNFAKYENVYFTILTNKELNIKQASWASTTEPIRDNKLVIITCTFKREEYVYKNIDLFKRFIDKNILLKDKIKLYVVDNGKTISKDIENDNVKLFPNKNAGGAGGFTRGIIEAKNSDENFTRILLMDDDVEVFPEAFYRTLTLSNYLQDEYRNSFIHGAMLNLCKKNMFYESTAIQNNNWCYSYHGQLDISKPQNVAATNCTPASLFFNKDKKVSSAWWYCCFSMESIHEKGLPLPVFYRCDDLEWSWRNFGEHHITMNGISVWHAPFEWRVSKPVEYYFSRRNIILINMLHTANYKKKCLKMLRKNFKHLIKTYDYTSCAIYLRMMRDLLSGSEMLKKDPEMLLKEIFEYLKMDNISECIEQSLLNSLKGKYNKYKIQKKYYRRFTYSVKKVFWELTMQGRLVPIFLWGHKKMTWSLAPSEEFMFYKKVNLYNFETNKIETRYYDAKRACKQKKRV